MQTQNYPRYIPPIVFNESSEAISQGLQSQDSDSLNCAVIPKANIFRLASIVNMALKGVGIIRSKTAAFSFFNGFCRVWPQEFIVETKIIASNRKPSTPRCNQILLLAEFVHAPRGSDNLNLAEFLKNYANNIGNDANPIPMLNRQKWRANYSVACHRALRICPYIPIGFWIVFWFAAFFKPCMLVRSVIQHLINNNFYIARMGLL